MADKTPAYIIAVKITAGSMTDLHWKTKDYGRANAANLEKVVEKYNESTDVGGCNEHLDGIKITAAELVKNDADRKIIATFGIA